MDKDDCITIKSTDDWKFKPLQAIDTDKKSFYFNTSPTSMYVSIQQLHSTITASPEEVTSKNKELWSIYCSKLSQIAPISASYNINTNMYTIIKGADILVNAITSGWNYIWIDVYEHCSTQDMSKFTSIMLNKVSIYEPIITIFLKNIATPIKNSIVHSSIDTNRNGILSKLNMNCYINVKRQKYKTKKNIVLVKYDIEIPLDTYTTNVIDIIKQLEKNGYTVIKMDNYWSDDDIYSGLNAVFQFYDLDGEADIFFEIQFHTPESYQLKINNSNDYITYDKLTDINKKCKLFEEITKRYKSLKIPKGILTQKVHKLENKHSIPHPCANK